MPGELEKLDFVIQQLNQQVLKLANSLALIRENLKSILVMNMFNADIFVWIMVGLFYKRPNAPFKENQKQHIEPQCLTAG